jgi:hypothetical protein
MREVMTVLPQDVEKRGGSSQEVKDGDPLMER